MSNKKVTAAAEKTELPKSARKMFSEWGKKGAEAGLKKYGKKRMSEMGKLGALKRWGSKKRKKN